MATVMPVLFGISAAYRNPAIHGTLANTPVIKEIRQYSHRAAVGPDPGPRDPLSLLVMSLVVMLATMSEVTRILSAIEQGEQHAAEQLLPLVYDELRKLAAHDH